MFRAKGEPTDHFVVFEATVLRNRRGMVEQFSQSVKQIISSI